MFSRMWMTKSTGTYSEKIKRFREKLNEADAVVVGAGSGLSTAAGFSYDGPNFTQHFSDFIEKYNIPDMYSGGFYPFEDIEEYWAWWSRQIYWNRYVDAPKLVYNELLSLIKDKDYFVLTTNVDHQFQKAGFDKNRLFYTQGDYGLFQCSGPCCQRTYDNEAVVRQMLARQKDMKIPSDLIPHCPVCGKNLTMNLRCDDTFVEDGGWHIAQTRYISFLESHKGMKVLFLELGVGGNTPVIIKYPFWQMTYENQKAAYVCVNYNEAFAPVQIDKQAI